MWLVASLLVLIAMGLLLGRIRIFLDLTPNFKFNISIMIFFYFDHMIVGTWSLRVVISLVANSIELLLCSTLPFLFI